MNLSLITLEQYMFQTMTWREDHDREVLTSVPLLHMPVVYKLFDGLFLPPLTCRLLATLSSEMMSLSRGRREQRT